MGLNPYEKCGLRVELRRRVGGTYSSEGTDPGALLLGRSAVAIRPTPRLWGASLSATAARARAFALKRRSSTVSGPRPGEQVSVLGEGSAIDATVADAERAALCGLSVRLSGPTTVRLITVHNGPAA